MSHVAKIDLVVTDLAALKRAAEALGGIWLEGRKTYKWWGHHVGDYPLPPGIAKEDLGHCDHVIKAPNVEYEIGVRRMADGTYTLLFDFYGNGRGLQERFCKALPLNSNISNPCQQYGIGLEKLKAEYAAAVAIAQLKRSGRVVTRKMVGDTIQLTAI
jgi:hypothetical protein